MEKVNFWQKLSPLYECRRYRIPTMQCPSFLFVMMGVIIMGVIMLTYFIAMKRLNDPKIVNLIVLGTAMALTVLDYIITNSFERISEADRMKSEFIHIVSHQLRAPLTNVKFANECLMDGEGKFSTEEREYLQISKENIEIMGGLIDKLLLVARIQTGKIPLTIENVSVTGIVKDTVMKFKPYSKASNINIVLKARDALPTVPADPFWLRQVVDNLIDNAIKYSGESGKIEIRAYEKDKRIYVSVSDEGVGIPAQEQKFIFQKFFRSENALKTQTHGSGLGLYIVKQVVEGMGGKIWFKSQEGKGTTFYFYIPEKNQKVS